MTIATTATMRWRWRSFTRSWGASATRVIGDEGNWWNWRRMRATGKRWRPLPPQPSPRQKLLSNFKTLPQIFISENHLWFFPIQFRATQAEASIKGRRSKNNRISLSISNSLSSNALSTTNVLFFLSFFFSLLSNGRLYYYCCYRFV